MTITGIKKIINKIVINTFVLTTLLMPVCHAQNYFEEQNTQTVVVEQTTQSTQLPTSTKKPNKEVKHVFGKFLHTLLLVGGSCLTIIFLLLLYKKFSNKKQQIVRNINLNKDLESPETIEDAVKLFIEKF